MMAQTYGLFFKTGVFQAKVENLKRTCFANIFLTNDERKIAITKNCARSLDEKMTRR